MHSGIAVTMRLCPKEGIVEGSIVMEYLEHPCNHPKDPGNHLMHKNFSEDLSNRIENNLKFACTISVSSENI